MNISQYEINIQSELDFSSKSITRTLMFSFHINFSLIYFVLCHVPKSCAQRLRNSGSTDRSENLRHVEFHYAILKIKKIKISLQQRNAISIQGDIDLSSKFIRARTRTVISEMRKTMDPLMIFSFCVLVSDLSSLCLNPTRQTGTQDSFTTILSVFKLWTYLTQHHHRQADITS